MKEEVHKSKTFYCPAEISDELDAIAREDDVSASQILRKITKEFIIARRKKRTEAVASKG